MINLNGEFVWWLGIVEDIQDPEKLGRARVRIHGYHTAKPRGHSNVITSLGEANISCNQRKQFWGWNHSARFPSLALQVFGFFLDGKRTYTTGSHDHGNCAWGERTREHQRRRVE